MSGDSITIQQFEARLRQLSSGALMAVLRKTMVSAAAKGQRYAAEHVNQRLATRSGSLVRSIRGTSTVKDELIEVRLGAGGNPPLKYAALQEVGGTVVPKTAKYLTIPVGPGLTTEAGVTKLRARDIPDLAYAQTKSGQPVLVRQSDGTVMFVLKRQVRVEGKHYLRDAAQRVAKELPDILTTKVKAAIGEGRT